jgi:FtsP/CotA-like multicopper oxidase with cupredoxin domain
MHLHGHFFRVIKNEITASKAYRKCTSNGQCHHRVLRKLWRLVFHCHILYHMMGGMARVFSYDTPRDTRMKGFPVSELVAETNRYYSFMQHD